MVRTAGRIASLLLFSLFPAANLLAQAPNISSISPVAGPVGTTVTITGTNFGSTQGTVTFNGFSAAPTTWTTTGITVTVPIAATTGNVVVTAAGQASNGRLFVVGNGPITYLYDDLGRLTAVVDSAGSAALYTYDAVGNILSIARQSSAQVAVISFAPKTGPVGTVVTISGTGFNTTPSQNTVKFNGTTASVTSATATQLITAVPVGATTGPIEVTNSSGSATSSTSFTVTGTGGAPTITSFSPSIAVAGAAVTITGTNFSTTPANDVTKFNLSAAVVGSATSTTISTTVPTATGSGRIKVSTPQGSATSTQDFFVPFGTHVAADLASTGRMVFGDTQTVSLGTASKIGMIVFDATAGQKASVQMSSGTFTNCTLYLFDPYANQLGSNSCAGATNFLDGQALSLAGTYSLGVESGSSTGSVALALKNASDVMGTIIVGGSPVTVTNTVPGQNAILKFSATANQKVSVSLSNGTYPAGSCNLSLKYSLAADLRTGSCGGTTNFVDTVTLPVTGNYLLTVDPTGTNTGSVTVKLNDVPDVVIGSSAGGGAVGASTSTPGQDARVTFSGTANQRISLTVSAVTIGSATVNLLRPDGSTQASMSINNTPGATFYMDTQTLATTGTYTVWIKHFSTYTGNATVQVYNVPGDVTGTMTIGGASVAVTTTAPGQNASLTFSGSATQKISISLSSGTYDACNLTLNKPDGNPLSSGNCSGATVFIDTVTLPTTGTYTVFLDPYLTATGSVTVRVNDNTDLTGTITAGGSAATVTTTVPGQDVRLTFSGTANQRISLLVSNVSIGFANVYVLKPDGSTQTSMSFNNSPGATFFKDTQTLASAGAYTLWVKHFSYYVGNATLQLYDVPADFTGTLTIGGAAATVTTTVPGQDGSLTFSGTSGQSVTVRMTSNTMSLVNVTLLKPDGSSLTSLGSNSSSFNLPAQTLPTTGTYTIKIDPSSTNTGSISVNVTTP